MRPVSRCVGQCRALTGKLFENYICVSPANAGREHSVQNGAVRLLVPRMRERKIESWEPENAFQSSQTSRYSQKICTLLSKMRVTGVQNGLRKRTKRTGRSPRPLCGLYCPISPISPMKTLCRAGVQNEVNRCPEWSCKSS